MDNPFFFLSILGAITAATFFILHKIECIEGLLKSERKIDEVRLPARSECKKYKDRGDDPCPWGRIFFECVECDDPELKCPWGRKFVDCIKEIEDGE
jgi:hypothetical protein